MKRTCPYSYTVAKGEQVTFDIVSYGTAKLVKMGLDGAPLNDPFSFKATNPSGEEHKVSTDFEFSPPTSPTPENDHYTITVKGSLGGQFDEPPIFRNDPINDPDFTFLVQ